MAVIPAGARVLDFGQALTYHRPWTQDDYRLVRVSLAQHYRPIVERYDELWFDEINDPAALNGDEAATRTLEWIEFTYKWYVPPSGTYVAGHRGKSRIPRGLGSWAWLASYGTNDIYLHAGFIRLLCETDNPVEVTLSGRKHSTARTPSTQPSNPAVCSDCWLVHPAGACEH